MVVRGVFYACRPFGATYFYRNETKHLLLRLRFEGIG
jgi:hypothetical protein